MKIVKPFLLVYAGDFILLTLFGYLGFSSVAILAAYILLFLALFMWSGLVSLRANTDYAKKIFAFLLRFSIFNTIFILLVILIGGLLPSWIYNNENFNGTQNLSLEAKEFIKRNDNPESHFGIFLMSGNDFNGYYVYYVKKINNESDLRNSECPMKNQPIERYDNQKYPVFEAKIDLKTLFFMTANGGVFCGY